MTRWFVRGRKRLALALLAAGLVASLAIFIWHSRPPFEVQLIGVGPSGIVDERGAKYLLVELAITNRGRGGIFFRNSGKRALGKVDGQWIEPQNLWRLSGNLRPGDHVPLMLLMPPGADVCRLHLHCQREAFAERA